MKHLFNINKTHYLSEKCTCRVWIARIDPVYSFGPFVLTFLENAGSSQLLNFFEIDLVQSPPMVIQGSLFEQITTRGVEERVVFSAFLPTQMIKLLPNHAISPSKFDRF